MMNFLNYNFSTYLLKARPTPSHIIKPKPSPVQL